MVKTRSEHGEMHAPRTVKCEIFTANSRCGRRRGGADVHVRAGPPGPAPAPGAPPRGPAFQLALSGAHHPTLARPAGERRAKTTAIWHDCGTPPFAHGSHLRYTRLGARYAQPGSENPYDPRPRRTPTAGIGRARLLPTRPYDHR